MSVHIPADRATNAAYPVEALAPIARADSLSRQAHAAIRKAIRDQLIVPGRLYSEGQAAGVLGISRTPVREALIELSREGIIEKVPQRGFRLRAISSDERDEVFELRALIESYVARRLAREASSGDIQILRRILDRQAGVSDDPTAFLEVDEEFHLTMAGLLGLAYTRRVLLTLRGIIWVSGLAAISRAARMSTVIREHRSVLDRIAARDPAGAARAVQHHIRRTAASASAAATSSEGSEAVVLFGKPQRVQDARRGGRKRPGKAQPVRARRGR